MNYDFYGNANESLCADVEFEVGSESVSSTDDLPIDADMHMGSKKEVSENKNATQIEKAVKKTTFKLVFGLSFVVLAIATPLFWINNQDEGHHYLVPT